MPDVFTVGGPLAATSYETASEASEPRAVAVIDGVAYPIVSYTYEENAHGATDTASITLTNSNNPDWTQVLFRGEENGNADQPVYVQLYAGYPTAPYASGTQIGQLQLRFYGVVDQYTIRLKSDEVTFACRSLAAPLVSNKITIPFSKNVTTVDFINQQAARFGLATKINLAATPLTITQVLGDEFISGVRNIGIWELMLQCAIQDNVDIWVDSQGVLNYQTASLVQRNTLDLKWGRDLDDIEITHSPQFSKNILVEVRTFNKKQRQSTVIRTKTNADGSLSTQQSTRTVTATPVFGTTQSLTTSVSSNGTTTSTLSNTTGGLTNASSGAPANESGRERYVFYVKNTSPAAAQTLSQQLWKQISQHEFSVTLHLPMRKSLLPKLSITSLIRLHGTPYAANVDTGRYYPRRITESFDPHQGWTIAVQAVNHPLAQGAV